MQAYDLLICRSTFWLIFIKRHILHFTEKQKRLSFPNHHWTIWTSFTMTTQQISCKNKASKVLACEQAHIWEHTRERQRANSKPERSFREESGDEGWRKWACPDLCKFFISASPERSEIPLVKKQERWQNCQSIMFHGKRLNPQGVDNLPRVQQLAWPGARRTIVCVYS